MKRSARFDSVDLLKFILSILVVTIHVGGNSRGLGFAIAPIQRMAVPLFFLITSYFFFSAFSKCTTDRERLARVKKYTKRNLQLYLFWFAALFIPTLRIKDWFGGGLVEGLGLMIFSFLFGSTFKASWFIMACVIAALVVAFLSRFLTGWQILPIAFVPYVACCCLTNYAQAPLVETLMPRLQTIFIGGANSFWAALLWFALGKLLVDEKDRIAAVGSKVLIVAAVCGFVVLYLEYCAITMNSWMTAHNDFYFALPLTCVPIFLLVLRSSLEMPAAQQLCNAGTITYCLHYTLYSVIRDWLAGFLNGVRALIIVLVICWTVAFVIMRLERFPRLRWLRFAH